VGCLELQSASTIVAQAKVALVILGFLMLPTVSQHARSSMFQPLTTFLNHFYHKSIEQADYVRRGDGKPLGAK
jgi:hypothetical protein